MPGLIKLSLATEDDLLTGPEGDDLQARILRFVRDFCETADVVFGHTSYSVYMAGRTDLDSTSALAREIRE